MVLTCRNHRCGANLYCIVPSPWCMLMGISSTPCSRSYMIWPVPTSSSSPIFNFFLRAVARKASYDLTLSIYLLQWPPTFSFLHLDCDFSKVYIWLSSHYSDVSWNVISSKRPSLTIFPFFHYFYSIMPLIFPYGVSFSVRLTYFIAYLSSVSSLECDLLMAQALKSY